MRLHEWEVAIQEIVEKCKHEERRQDRVLLEWRAKMEKEPLERAAKALNVSLEALDQSFVSFTGEFVQVLCAGSDICTAVQAGKIALARHINQAFLKVEEILDPTTL